MRLHCKHFIATLFLLILGMVPQLHSQVAVTLGAVPKAQFLDNSGRPLSGGKVYSFQAGTNVQLATYADFLGTIPNANPIILDSAGRANVWFQFRAYKIVVQTSGGVTLYTTDGYQPPISVTANNSFTGNNVFNGSTTFNAPVTFGAGGVMTGTFSGNPTFTGTINFANAVFSGTETFASGLLTDSITGITAGSTLAILGASGGGLGENIKLTTGSGVAFGSSSGEMDFITNDALGISGSLNLKTGVGNTTGDITLSVGRGITNPGKITLKAGDAGQNFNPGGNITLTSGNGFGAKGGNIQLIGGTGGVDLIQISPSPTGHIQLNTSLDNDASGFKHIRAPLNGTCPTAAGVGDTCTSANIDWTTPFIDNGYTLTCTLESVVNVPTIVVATKLAAGAGFTVTIAAVTAAAANGTADCIAVHD